MQCFLGVNIFTSTANAMFIGYHLPIHTVFPRGLGVKTTFTAGTYKPVVVVTIIEGSHPAVVAR